MVAKHDLLEKAAHSIETALCEFLAPTVLDKVWVFDTEVGHLEALVAHPGFKNLTFNELVELQDRVWKHLREKVKPELLAYLFRVHLMTPEEYDARTRQV